MGLKTQFDILPRPFTSQRWAAILLSVMVSTAVTAGGDTDNCPERCGEVLKACLEKNANRYLCIDVTEKCVTACKAGKPPESFLGSDACRFTSIRLKDAVHADTLLKTGSKCPFTDA